MRDVSIPVIITKEVQAEVVATKEEILRINENKINANIEVEVALKTDNDEVLQVMTYYIVNDKYELLMSESPEFAEGKPANEYREIDLWYIIDLIRKSL